MHAAQHVLRRLRAENEEAASSWGPERTYVQEDEALSNAAGAPLQHNMSAAALHWSQLDEVPSSLNPAPMDPVLCSSIITIPSCTSYAWAANVSGRTLARASTGGMGSPCEVDAPSCGSSKRPRASDPVEPSHTVTATDEQDIESFLQLDDILDLVGLDDAEGSPSSAALTETCTASCGQVAECKEHATCESTGCKQIRCEGADDRCVGVGNDAAGSQSAVVELFAGALPPRQRRESCASCSSAYAPVPQPPRNALMHNYLHRPLETIETFCDWGNSATPPSLPRPSSFNPTADSYPGGRCDAQQTTVAPGERFAPGEDGAESLHDTAACPYETSGVANPSHGLSMGLRQLLEQLSLTSECGVLFFHNDKCSNGDACSHERCRPPHGVYLDAFRVDAKVGSVHCGSPSFHASLARAHQEQCSMQPEAVSRGRSPAQGSLETPAAVDVGSMLTECEVPSGFHEMALPADMGGDSEVERALLQSPYSEQAPGEPVMDAASTALLKLPLPPPSLVVGCAGNAVPVSLNALYWWEKLGLHPLAMKKQLVYAVLCPESTSTALVSLFCQQLGVMYRACQLGTFVPMVDWLHRYKALDAGKGEESPLQVFPYIAVPFAFQIDPTRPDPQTLASSR